MNTPTKLFRGIVLIATSACIATLSNAADLFGITDVDNGSVALFRINPANATPTHVKDFSVGPDVIAVENLTFHHPTHRFLTRVLTTGGVSRTLGILDPSSMSLVEVPITGLPAGQEKINGLDYQASLDRIVVTFGPEATSLEDKLAEIDIAGNVLQTSPDLGLGDRDDVYAHPVLGELIPTDFNDGLPRFAIVTDPFGTPSVATLVNPPADGEFSDATIEPGTGRILATRRATNDLFEIDLNTSNYVSIGAYNTQATMSGITFVPEPSTLALAGIGLIGSLVVGRRRHRAA